MKYDPNLISHLHHTVSPYQSLQNQLISFVYHFAKVRTYRNNPEISYQYQNLSFIVSRICLLTIVLMFFHTQFLLKHYPNDHDYQLKHTKEFAMLSPKIHVQKYSNKKYFKNDFRFIHEIKLHLKS
jgi:hypothetical protein